MGRTKYILIRPKDPARTAQELMETVARITVKGLELTEKKPIKRHGKNYYKLIFKTPEDEPRN